MEQMSQKIVIIVVWLTKFMYLWGMKTYGTPSRVN
jgi:hypothetical protein